MPLLAKRVMRGLPAADGDPGQLSWYRDTAVGGAGGRVLVREDGREMINGAHIIVYSKDAEADREFIRDVLGFNGVDAGGGWLIFQLPPAELAAHPTDGAPVTELYLMCDDIEGTLAELTAKGVRVSEQVSDQGWGLLASIGLPSGADLGIYQPRHPTAHGS